MGLKFQTVVVTALVGFGIFWGLGAEHPLGLGAIPQHAPNVENGKLIYTVGGCISCHASPANADVPSGGKPLKTPIGVLYPPNLTPDNDTGLGKWDNLAFVNAMQRGLHPGGGHLIPAFPYTSYAKMTVNDVLDLKAYLATLPAVKNAVPANDVLAMPIVRRGLGLWKWVGLDETPFQADPAHSPAWNRGAYLVNGPGHCQECHTPRNLFLASDHSAAFMGGPHPDGKGKVPSLRGLIERNRYKDAADLVLAFQNGEAFGYDHMASGGMGEVQNNLSKLPDAELAAIAEYVVSLK